MMKSGILTFVAIIYILQPINAHQMEGFSIYGKIKGLEDGVKVHLRLCPEGRKDIELDSTVTKNEEFKFKGYLPDGLMRACIFFVVNKHVVVRWLNLDNCDVRIVGSIDGGLSSRQTISVEGSPLMSDASAFEDVIQVFKKSEDALYGSISKGYLDKLRDSIGYDDEVMNGIMSVRNLYKKAVMDKLSSEFSVYSAAIPFVYCYYYKTIGHEAFWPKLFRSFSAEAQKGYYGKLMEKRLYLCVGAKAPEFSSLTPEGKLVSLKDIIGGRKLVLIDFWASWCAYCRAEGSEMLIPLYKRYNKDGFDILGVSLDEDKGAWTKAISLDGYPWIQISSLKGREEPVYKLYNASTPGNVLLDGEGKIVAWNIHDPLEMEWYIRKYTNSHE